MTTGMMDAFFELSSDMVGIIGFDWVPRKLNSKWTTELGWSLEELCNLSLKTLIHPDDLEKTQAHLERCSAGTSQSMTVLNRYRCKDGSFKYLNWHFKNNHEAEEVYVVVKDITRQKHFDEVLINTQQSTRVGTWHVDLKSQDAYWSPELYEIFDLDPQTDLMSLEGSGTYFTDEDQIRVKSHYESLISGGSDYDFEATVVSAKGRHVPVRIIGSALRTEQGVSRVFGIVQDISREKEGARVLRYQQHLLNGLLDSLPAIVFVKDLEGRYILINKEFEKLMKKSKDIIIGKNDYELFSPRDALRHRQKDEEVIQTGQLTKCKDDILVEDGSERHYLSDKFPLLDEHGKIFAIAGVATDISELHKHQKELLHAKDLAEAGTKAKSEFLANMSHEIRTPMNSILGMAEILLDSDLNKEQRNFVSILNRASESLLHIINDILDLSKIESGHLHLESAPYSIRDVVRKSVELLMVKALAKNISLEFSIDKQVPEKLQGDATRVQQVLINLIGNGLKFTEKGRVFVSVNQVEVHGQSLLEVAVEDTGIGLESGHKQWIFGRFSQGDSSVTRRFGGTGLGLSISQQLVEKMGGKIEVESQLGQGARFHFTLPLVGVASVSSKDI